MRISSLLSFLLGFHGFRMFNTDPAAGGGGGGDPTPVAPKAETFSREYVHELREENKTWRTKLGERDTAFATEKARADAAEAARDTAKAEAETAANERVMRAELKAHALKHGIVDLKGLAMLDITGLKLSADGELEGADALFEAAKTSMPYLFGKASTSSTSRTPDPKANEPKDARKLNDAEYAAQKQAYLASARKR